MHLNDSRLPHHLRPTRPIPDIPEQSDDVDIASDVDRALSWGWVSGKPVFGVSFEWPDGLHRSFRYMHLESDMVWKGDTITMRFGGIRSYSVTIKGLRLEKLYYLLQDDRMRAVRQVARDFDSGDVEPLVQSIVIEEIKEDD